MNKKKANRKRFLAMTVALIMVLALVPIGAFGLEAAAYAVEYHLPEEMGSDSENPTGDSSTDSASDKASDTEYVTDDATNEENATEEAPSYDDDENATEENPSYDDEDDATEEAPSNENEDEPTEEKETDNEGDSGCECDDCDCEECECGAPILGILPIAGFLPLSGNQINVNVSDNGQLREVISGNAWLINDAFGGQANFINAMPSTLFTTTQQFVDARNAGEQIIINITADILRAGGINVVTGRDIVLRSDNDVELLKSSESNARHFSVSGNSTLTLEEGITLRGHGSVGGGIMVHANSSFTMYDGLITGNGFPGVTLDGSHATFNMHGGTISNNHPTGNGGGVFIVNGGIANISRGIIENNTGLNGGGIFVGNTSTLTITGATIRDNSTTGIGGNASTNWAVGIGGGIAIGTASIVNISQPDGTNPVLIYNNNANSGGGVSVTGLATVNITGGTIRNNGASIMGGGVFAMHTLALSIANPASVYSNSAIMGNNSFIRQSPDCGTLVVDSESITDGFTHLAYGHEIFLTEDGRITFRVPAAADKAVLTDDGDLIISSERGYYITIPGSAGAGSVDIIALGDTSPTTIPEGSTVIENPVPDRGGAIVIPPNGGNPVEVPPGGSVDTDGTPRDADGNTMFVVGFLHYDGVFFAANSVLLGGDAYDGFIPDRTPGTNWTFVGWNHPLTNVQRSFDTTAMFSITVPPGGNIDLPNNDGTITAPPDSTVTYPNYDGNVDVELPNNGGTVTVPPGSTVTEPDEDGNISVTPPGSDRPITVPPGSDVGLPDEDGNIPVTPPGSNEPTPVPPGGSIGEDGNVQDEDGESWPPEQPQTPEPPELEITTQPQATGTNLINDVATVTQGQISGNLSITATATEGAVLTYQWYRNNTAIAGATTASILIPTDLALGLHNFHVVVTATINPSVSVTSNMIAINVVAPTGGGITPPPGDGSSGSGDDSGNNSDGNDGNSGSGTGNQPGTNQPGANQPGATTPDNNLPDAGQSNDNNQGNNDTANQTANNAWADLNDTTTPGGNLSTATPNPITSDNALVQFDDMWIELDDTGVPLGAWTWDEAQDMWIFDENVPLAAVATVAGVTAVTSQVAEAVALMPQTDVESNAMQFALLFALAMIIAVASLVVIKYETKKRIK